MRYLIKLFLITVFILAPITICKETIYDEIFSMEARVLKGELGSFYAQITDTYGNPISNEFVVVGEWAAVTSPNGIIYLDKLPLGKYPIVPYIGAEKISGVFSVEIKNPKDLAIRYYIYDRTTKTITEAIKPPVIPMR